MGLIEDKLSVVHLSLFKLKLSGSDTIIAYLSKNVQVLMQLWQL